MAKAAESAKSTKNPSKGFARGNERLEALKARPGAAERVAAIREEMREADRIHAESVAAIRKAADRTQIEVANELGVGQGVVSRMERSDDMLLSTLAKYLAANGAEDASIVVRVGGVDVELDLLDFAKQRDATR